MNPGNFLVALLLTISLCAQESNSSNFSSADSSGTSSIETVAVPSVDVPLPVEFNPESTGPVSQVTDIRSLASEIGLQALTGPFGMQMDLYGRIETYDKTTKLDSYIPQIGFERFLREVQEAPVSKRMSFIEMGLNSNNPAIFYHCVEKVLTIRHFAAIPILKSLLDRGDAIDDENRVLIYTNYKKLLYYSTSIYARTAFLEEMFLRDSPTLYPELITWGIEQFGEVANLKNVNALRPLQTYPTLGPVLDIVKEKLALNSNYPDKIERYISATQSQSESIRKWGLDHLIKFDSPKVAKYLTLLYQQTNLNFGQREYDRILESLETHRKNHSVLYEKLGLQETGLIQKELYSEQTQD